ncbi:MAG: TlpA family protein disulfide reductase [Thermoleophilaceae bacterium]
MGPVAGEAVMGGRLRLFLVAAVAAVAVAALVVSLGRSDTGPGGGGDASAGRGRVAPLALTTLEGRRLDLPRGRPGALFLTVSSCLSCIPSAQALGELKARYGDRLDAVWIGIDPTDPPEQVRARRESMGNPPYPFAIDRSGTLANLFAVRALGTTIVYDADGRIVSELIEPSKDQLESAFRKAGVS